MTNDDAVLREVDQALAEERQVAGLRRRLPLLIGAAVLTVGGVGFWQFNEARMTRLAAEDASAYRAATADGKSDAAALETLRESATPGYRALARLQLAAGHVAAGERDKALELYRAVYSEKGATARVKEIARLRAAYISVEQGREAALSDLGDLADSDAPLGAYARELSGLAAIKAGDYQTAEQIFRALAASATAPEPVKNRAGEFAALASAGKSGVALDAMASAAASPVKTMVDQMRDGAVDLGAALEAAGAQPQADTQESEPQQ